VTWPPTRYLMSAPTGTSPVERCRAANTSQGDRSRGRGCHRRSDVQLHGSFEPETPGLGLHHDLRGEAVLRRGGPGREVAGHGTSQQPARGNRGLCRASGTLARAASRRSALTQFRWLEIQPDRVAIRQDNDTLMLLISQPVEELYHGIRPNPAESTWTGRVADVVEVQR